MTAYLFVKAMHIIGFVCWFAGLFYSVRLFIYHREADSRPENERIILQKQLLLMAQRLWKYITNPAMIITLIFGIALLGMYRHHQQPWIMVKLLLIFALIGYHHVCKRVLKQLASNSCKMSSAKLRLFNEVATVLLVCTVFVAVFKQPIWGLWSLLGLGGFALLFLAIRHLRRQQQQ